MKERRKRREFTDEFKESIVKLYNSGKSRASLVREYDLTASAVSSWIRKYNDTGSFNVNDNRSEEDKQLIKLGSVYDMEDLVDKSHLL
jgi:transposase